MSDDVTAVHWWARARGAAPAYDLALFDVDVWEQVNATCARGLRPSLPDETTAGTAMTSGYAQRLLSWWPGSPSPLPGTHVDPRTEPAAALFTSYPLALTGDDCDRVIAYGHAHAMSEPSTTSAVPSLTIGDELPDIRDRACATVTAANAAWWHLDIDRFRVVLLRYGPGHRFPEHQDMHPGQWHRKIAATFQLSEPADHQGGDLMLRAWHDQAIAPKARGSATVFPGWTSHEVTEVTAGTRWSLVVWGYGPPLR